MPKPFNSERFYIDGPAGRLEAIIESPANQNKRGSAVVCHPHPQHGGTMHNKVVHTLVRAFAGLGYAVLRFNFRGTEGSEGQFDNGVGELDDALAAIAWMQETQAASGLWLAGFSFGAAIAVRAALETEPDGLVSVAPALSRFASGLPGQPRCPWFVVQGDADELVGVDETIDWMNRLEPGPELRILSDAEHFFHGRLIELRQTVAEFVGRSDASQT